VFQALGNGVYSLAVSVSRQLIVLLPVAWILARTGGLDAVWWAFPIAELASITVSILLFRRIYRQKLKPLEKSES
jgi:Na+-driven multidrug efflux pump